MPSNTNLSDSDLQALQHAVGEANNVYASIPDSTASKKKRKRKEKHPAGESDEVEIEDHGEDKQKKKKRKQKTSGNDAEVVETGPTAEAPDTTAVSTDQPKKKKSKKRDKGKQPEAPTESFPAQTIYSQQQQQSNPNPFDVQGSSPSSAPASTAAFLSALVTAASETQNQTGPHEQHPNMQYHPHQQPQFMQYQSMGYPYHPGPPGHYPPPPLHHQQPSLLPMGGIPLGDLALASNEDILRALQDLDMTKIASVLKTLGEAAASSNGIHPNGPFGAVGPPPQDIPGPTPLNQVPTTAGDILNTNAVESKQQQLDQASAQGRPGHNRVLDMSLPGPELHMNTDHAYMLANKWMNPSKLTELVKTEGLVYKKGKFSAIEEKQLHDAIENYRASKGLTPEQTTDLIFAKNDKKDNDFWSEITFQVPQRPIIAVYHHVRRSYHPMKQQGKWMESEDASLLQAVADLGQAWEKVSVRVGRMSGDCRDRYRNHLANREIRSTGHWKKEEEEELTRIVTEMTTNQGKDFDNDVFWGQVAERMGNKRGRQQCRIKWTDALSKTVKNEGQKPRWSQQDAYILVHKVDSLNVRDDTEIDWKTLPDPGWNFWSAHSLQRRWLTLKRSIKGFEEMTHQEIMDILRVKKAQLPVPPITATKKQKTISSAATIVDEDSPEAGSSTGPGTRGDVVS